MNFNRPKLDTNDPFSRNQESESDEIGLIYIAKGGIQPRRSCKPSGSLCMNREQYGKSTPPIGFMRQYFKE